MNRNTLPAGQDLRYLHAAALVWVAPLLVIAAMVAIDPVKNSVMPVYHGAVEDWWAGRGLYSNQASHVFFYFPQFAVLFAPFHLIPASIGDNLWRFLSAGLLAWGTLRLMRLFDWPNFNKAFLFCSLLTILPSLGALRCGQANLTFAAVMVHMVLFLAEKRWRAASLSMIGLMVLKPIALAPVLLALVIYRPALITFLPLMAVFLIFPFFFAPFDYVTTQYHDLAARLLTFSAPRYHLYADLNGLLKTVGYPLSNTASPLVRFAAGLAALGLWITAAARTREPMRALILLALSTAYLMIFNPMTEVNGYTIVAPALGIFAVYYLMIEKRTAIALWLVFADVSISLFPEIFRRLDRNFGLWWDPLAMLMVAVPLAVGIVRNRVFDQSQTCGTVPEAGVE